MCISSLPRGLPNTCKRMPYWSDQKYGTGANAGASARPAIRLRAGGHAGLGRDLPMLNPDQLLAAITTPLPARDVPRRHDAVRREEPLVTDHAVVDGEAGVSQPVRRRHHADAHDDHVGVECLAATELDHEPAGISAPGRGSSVPGGDTADTPHAHAGAQIHAMRFVQRTRSGIRSGDRERCGAGRPAPRGR